MKKISLKGISEILSEKELKNVMGGSSEEDGCTLYQHDYLADDLCYYDIYICPHGREWEESPSGCLA